MLQQIVSNTTRRLRDGRIEEKTVRVRTYNSDYEYEQATGTRAIFSEPVSMSNLSEAIDEYMRNVKNLEW